GDTGIDYAGLILMSDEDLLSGDIELVHLDVKGALFPKRSTMGSDGISTVNYRDHWENFSVPTLIKFETRLLQEGPTAGYTFPFNFDFKDPNITPNDGTANIDVYDYN